MWCSNCQQDVPAIASPEDQRIRCAKCRDEVPARRSAVDVKPRPTSFRTLNPPLYENNSRSIPASEFVEWPMGGLEDWKWDEDLQEAERIVRSWGGRAKRVSETSSVEMSMHESDVPARRAQVAQTSPAHSTKPRRNRWTGRGSVIAWAVLSLGIMGFVFGCVLLGWSYFTQRQELWTLGLPFALGGQAALIIGLVLQLDGLFQSNHEAAETLDDLDSQLEDLRHATSRISTSHSGPAQSFYLHLAEGCSPHMLLADLKGQLDLLAMRIADDK